MLIKTKKQQGKGFAAALPLITALAPSAIQLISGLFKKKKQNKENGGKVLKRMRQIRKAGACCGKCNR
jgi:hypothetical protein